MRVICAEAMGVCFGVADALEVMRGMERAVEVTVRGELVHNARVMREVRERGFSVMGEEEAASGRVPGTEVVVVTAHGVSDSERGRLLAAGKKIVDTTCPLVRRAHRAAVGLSREGYFVVVVGKRGHVEVRGLTGDLGDGGFVVVEAVGEVREYGREKIGVMAQTTAVERELEEICARVREKNPRAEVRVVNTVCGPTRERQAALERVLERVDVVVVVGGRNSNNTLRLVERARERGVRAVRVEEASELSEEMFLPWEAVGLTAGTSVMPEVVEGVRRKLESCFAEGREMTSDEARMTNQIRMTND
ncbi:MAG: 4-hydroxy-3-methylbut-2-enyl diphosphate reductase [Phycisphaerae bacterium]